jgi:hypothetical protein
MGHSSFLEYLCGRNAVYAKQGQTKSLGKGYPPEKLSAFAKERSDFCK